MAAGRGGLGVQHCQLLAGIRHASKADEALDKVRSPLDHAGVQDAVPCDEGGRSGQVRRSLPVVGPSEFE